MAQYIVTVQLPDSDPLWPGMMITRMSVDLPDPDKPLDFGKIGREALRQAAWDLREVAAPEPAWMANYVAETGDGQMLTAEEALALEENGNVIWNSELARVQAVANSGALMVMSDYPGFRLTDDGTVVEDR